jgi:hypothetical protein
MGTATADYIRLLFVPPPDRRKAEPFRIGWATRNLSPPAYRIYTVKTKRPEFIREKERQRGHESHDDERF